MNGVIRRLRRPEYTGENRCWRCTAVNVALLVAVVTALAAAGWPGAAAAAALGGGGLVWLRGYLLPFTPRLPPALARWLAGGPSPRTRRFTDSLVDGGANGEAVLSSLLDAGVLIERGPEVELSTGFRERWRAEINELAVLDDAPFADAVVEVAPDVERARVVADDGGKFVVLRTGDGADRDLWLPRPVAVAEVAALRALPDTVPDAHRTAAARPLRLFIERCPACGGRVETTPPAALRDRVDAIAPDEDPEEVFACWDCGEPLYTF